MNEIYKRATQIIDEMKIKSPCRFCLDASCDPTGELTEGNDYSSLSVGRVKDGCRMSIDAGYGKPLRICVTQWNPTHQQNEQIAFYQPRFCPECGRCLK